MLDLNLFLTIATITDLFQQPPLTEGEVLMAQACLGIGVILGLILVLLVIAQAASGDGHSNDATGRVGGGVRHNSRGKDINRY